MAVIPEEGYSFIFNPESKEWNSQTVVNLSDDERTMLRLTMQGHSLEQIGGIMFKSMETIKKAVAVMVTSAHTLVVYYSCTVQNYNSDGIFILSEYPCSRSSNPTKRRTECMPHRTIQPRSSPCNCRSSLPPSLAIPP